jgi:hypothetical protein
VAAAGERGLADQVVDPGRVPGDRPGRLDRVGPLRLVGHQVLLDEAGRPARHLDHEHLGGVGAGEARHELVPHRLQVGRVPPPLRHVRLGQPAGDQGQIGLGQRPQRHIIAVLRAHDRIMTPCG